jgi:hypothetical protein
VNVIGIDVLDLENVIGMIFGTSKLMTSSCGYDCYNPDSGYELGGGYCCYNSDSGHELGGSYNS